MNIELNNLMQQYSQMSSSPDKKTYFKKFTYDEWYIPIRFINGNIRGRVNHGFSCINDVTINIVITSLVIFLKNTIHNYTVFVGFDEREHSKLFAFIAAKIFHKCKYSVFMHTDPVITPFVSYMAKELSVGIMITASHNNAQYNGIKIFLQNGLSIGKNAMKRVEQNISNLNFTVIDMEENYFSICIHPTLIISSLKFLSPYDFKKHLKAYCEKSISKFDMSSFRRPGKKVLFCPLNGTASTFLKEMAELTYCNDLVFYYDLQCDLVKDFGCFLHTNPEKLECFFKLMKLAENNDIDNILITDPDGDRIRFAQRKRNLNIEREEWHIFDADEMAILLSLLIIPRYKPEEIVFLNTKYCSNVLKEICTIRNHDHMILNNIDDNFSSVVNNLRHNGKRGILAYDKSYGFLVCESIVRDAIPCAILFIHLIQITSNLKKLCNSANMKNKHYCIKKVYYTSNPRYCLNEWIHMLRKKHIIYRDNDDFKIVGKELEISLKIGETNQVIEMYAKSQGKSKEELEIELMRILDQIK